MIETNGGTTMSTNGTTSDRLEDRLERLAALHSGGQLTDDEFAAAKSRLLHPAAADSPDGTAVPWAPTSPGAPAPAGATAMGPLKWRTWLLIAIITGFAVACLASAFTPLQKPAGPIVCSDNFVTGNTAQHFGGTTSFNIDAACVTSTGAIHQLSQVPIIGVLWLEYALALFVFMAVVVWVVRGLRAGAGGRPAATRQTGLSDIVTRVTTGSVTTRQPTARERLLAAADELFYEEGVQTVGIDRVIERAGVAKATLYSAFGSKEELIRAYLSARHQAKRAQMARQLERCTTPRERLLGPFDLMLESCALPGFHGCAFVNASAEARPGGAVEEISDQQRGWTRSLFVDLAAQAGITDPDVLAGQLVVLYDGAIVGARMDRSSSSAIAARATAAVLVDLALAASTGPA